MQSQFPGGVFVTAGPVASIEPEEFVSSETLRIIRETPGVRGVFDQVVEKIVYRGEQVLLFGGRMDVMARFGRLAILNGDPRKIAEAVAAGALVVSDRFAQHFGVRAGDTITLDTPKGPRSFRIAGVNRDYSGPAGSINIESSVFEALWPRRGSRDLVLWTEGDPAPVISEIRRQVGETQTLFFVYGDDLAHFASRILRRFQMIVMSVALLTAVLGGIAIWNVMLGAVTVRRRELALLLATGATQRQIRALTLIDALLLAGCGGVAGIVLGLCSGYPVVLGVMTDAVGWSLSFSVSPRDLLILLASLLCAALLASLYPAWLAARVPMGEVSGAE
jgi:putative ABC transport system permease protein